MAGGTRGHGRLRFPRISGGEALLGLAAAALLAVCVMRQADHYQDYSRGSGLYEQKVRLPEPELIRFASLGYQNLYADFLTLRAIQMFGASWKTPDDSTEPIYEFFDTITELDPHFVDVYELGNLVIADSRGDFDLGLKLVRKGIRKNPGAWRLPYLGIYTALWGMQEPSRAREFLRYLHRIKDAPEHILRLEEYIERQSGRFRAAYDINIGYYLRYVDNGMEVEQNISKMRFQAIMDSWNRLELARAASEYFKVRKEHPKSLENLLTPEFMPRFEAPTMQRLAASLAHYANLGGALEPHKDSIRDESIEEIEGLPPEPFGTWYFLYSPQRDQVAKADDVTTAPLDQRFPYFAAAHDFLQGIDMTALKAQERIQSTLKGTGKPPEREDLTEYLTEDPLGGHYVYLKDGTKLDGEPGPRFFSTTTLRITRGQEPRMGLRGTLDRFPQRRFFATDGQPAWLQTEPTIWDFEEDAEWAFRFGLEPGVPFHLQSEELQAKARAKFGYIPGPMDD
ncbi:hypothetical protein HZA57_07585 [Candidatus Poribacteria bacterium]|nr:hypothetical protein [Candidatus Poribacteria bacterium]